MSVVVVVVMVFVLQGITEVDFTHGVVVDIDRFSGELISLPGRSKGISVVFAVGANISFMSDGANIPFKSVSVRFVKLVVFEGAWVVLG